MLFFALEAVNPTFDWRGIRSGGFGLRCLHCAWRSDMRRVGNFSSQDFDICLRNVCGSFMEICGEWPTIIAVICGDDESAQHVRILAREIPYTWSPSQDFRLFGPRPWKVLATTYEQMGSWATQTLAKILWAGILLWRPGVSEHITL